MRLSSLEIQGFKSFPDKTHLEFGDGITTVVGPNGSGKSNIADAIRWVFGEQSTKTLRGGKMEDVIFSGTQTRKAMGYALVKLTIDNLSKVIMSEHAQITISRKLYRSGESEYRINSNMVRLKDVNELFLDTGLGRDGYSIIGQGRIADIISAKSNQRREIFEEAAGIAKFRYRRVEATKQLDNAEENLIRLKDILLELEDRVGILRVQSDKAKKYIGLADEKKELEISIWIDSLNNYKKELSDQQNKISISKNDYNILDRQTEGMEENLLEIHGSMQSLSVKVDILRIEIKENDDILADNSSKIAVFNNDLLHNSQSINKLTAQIESADIGEEDLKKLISIKEIQHGEAFEKLTLLKQEILTEQNRVIENLEKAEEKQKELDNLVASKTALDSAVSETKIKQAADVSTIRESGDRLDELKKRDNQYDYLVNENTENLKDCNQQIESKQAGIKSLDNSKNGYALKQKSRDEKRQGLISKKDLLEQDIKNIDSKVKILKDMETNMEGYYGSVKYILSQAKKGSLRGIIGAVSGLISTETKYVTAIETALGAAAQNIVVEDENTAKQAIEMLKQAKAGRATLLPITAVKGKEYNFSAYINEYGFVGSASKLVEYDSKLEGIVNQILGRTCIVDDLDTGIRLAKKAGYSFKIVTLDGQVINAGGSYTGGSVSKSAGVLGRKNEIERLENNRIKVLKEIDEFKPELEKFQQELAYINAMLLGIDAEVATAQEDIVRLTFGKEQLAKDLHNANINRELAKKELENLSARLKELEEGKLSAEQLINENEQRSKELEIETADKQQQKLELSENNEAAKQKLSVLQLKELELQKDNEIIKDELDRFIKQSENAKEQLEAFNAEKNILNESNDKIAVEISVIEQLKKDIELQIENKNKEITEDLASRTQLEKSTTELRQREREIASKREEVSRELVRLEERQRTMQTQYDEIIAKMWDEYELTRSLAAELAKPLENKQKASSRLAEVRSAIRGLGSVNLEAVEEYAEVGERYDFLSAQLKDVEDSKAQLLKMVDELTEEMRILFADNFEKISVEFSKIFVELFGGGRGELKLTDQSDILESGIDIVVQPPGKVIKNLSLLSGGEQAFVAITIYFAILKVKPAPFVLLDEIEAALDDINVVKYASYLRTLSNNIQFICITHRRGTMEEADALYGVTMQENGVSKLLELKINELESKIGMEAEG